MGLGDRTWLIVDHTAQGLNSGFCWTGFFPVPWPLPFWGSLCLSIPPAGKTMGSFNCIVNWRRNKQLLEETLLIIHLQVSAGGTWEARMARAPCSRRASNVDTGIPFTGDCRHRKARMESECNLKLVLFLHQTTLSVMIYELIFLKSFSCLMTSTHYVASYSCCELKILMCQI